MSFLNLRSKHSVLRKLLHSLDTAAYVNGQRQGRIMEKPFCIGDSIARENLAFETSERPLPFLRVEDELKLVLDSKESLDGNAVAQKMKELGLER